MVGLSFESSGSKTFLVYRIQPQDVVDTIILGMISNNEIIGLMPPIYSQKGSEGLLLYDITSKISLKQYLSGTVSRKCLLDTFDGLAAVLAGIRKHMMDVSMLVLDMEYIYVDISTSELELICLPVINREKQYAYIEGLFKKLVVNIQYDENEDCRYIAAIINILNCHNGFSLSSLKKVMEELRWSDEPQAEEQAELEGMEGMEYKSIQQSISEAAAVMAGSGSGNTEPLGPRAGIPNVPYLLRLRNGEKIYINKPVFRIGKEKSYVDYFTGYNPAISRSHADIISRDGEYFIIDNDSTNLTYVNDVIIKSHVEINLSHGVRVRLANEEFEFNLY